jgi:hypothetical protein
MKFEYKNMRWLICLIFFGWSCSSTTGYGSYVETKQDSLAKEQKAVRAFFRIDSLGKTIHSGDLVVRTGADFTSEGLRSLNQRDQTYSHCGICSIENDSVFVYHSLGGEWNPDQKIRRDPLAVFAEPYSNRGIGLYRFPFTTVQADTLLSMVHRLHDLGVMFDMKFDLASNDHMYCAEFVYKSYTWGTSGRLKFPTSHIGAFQFIGVDDIFLHPDCREQARLLYK